MSKKTLIAACVFVFAAVFSSGCANSTNDDKPAKNTSLQEKRIGAIRSLGGAYNSTGATHILTMEDGKTLHLKSQNVSLDNEKYREKQIEVMGEIMRTRDGNQIMDVMSVDILEQENSVATKIPLWTEYKSEKIGVSFKYRDDYQVEEAESIVIKKQVESDMKQKSLPIDNNTSSVSSTKTLDQASSSTQSKMLFSLVSSDTKRLAELMGVDSLESSDVLAGGFTRSKITQKGLDAYKKVVSSDEIVYWTANENGIYKLQYVLSKNEQNKTEFQNMFFDILASMEFTGNPLKSDITSSENSLNSEAENNKKIPESETLNSSQNDTNLGEKPISPEKDNALSGDNSSGGAAKVTQNNNEKSKHTEENLKPVTTFEEINGFSTFQSESAGFSLQYPKSYYFGPNDKKPSDALRSYQFGNSPLEETPGDIIFDVFNGSIPQGTKQSFNGIDMIMVTNGKDAVFYAEFDGKKYRISGPSQKTHIMKQMLSTVR